ncbi:MAG: cobalamin-binding protein [Acidobacteriota bacterium]
MLRIVSLLPAATEIICALGAGDSLVGISHECDHPLEIQGLPRLTKSAVTGKTSAQIDADVHANLSAGLSLYEIDWTLLAELRPDLIVTQDLCDVCAASAEQVEASVRSVAGLAPKVLRLSPARFDDLYRSIDAVAEATGRHATASELCGGIRRRVDEVAERAARVAEVPKVLTLEWIEPPMQGGYWTPDIVTLAGGVPLAAVAGEPSRVLAADELASLAPDVVVVKPCGFSLDRALEELRSFRALVPWRLWPAARSGRVYFADGNAWFNRPGPRLADSLEVLAMCLHPVAFRDFRRAYGYGVARITTDLMIERW